MKTIWAPWRIEYIRQTKAPGCILCDKPKENNDEANQILFRGKYNFILMNNYPYNPGHLMVVPYRHIANLEELNSKEKLELFEIITRSIGALKTALKPAGFIIGINLGRVAGAGIDDHVHAHVVPRWSGDTNFMPVIADVRVVPQAVADTYKQLKDCFK
jgi:ATP adenylyltransferase